MARAGRVPGRGSTRGAMPPFWLAVPEIPGWAAGSSEAWSSNGSGDGNSNSNSNSTSGEAGARRLQPEHLLQVAVQTETAHRQRADQARVDGADATAGHALARTCVGLGKRE